MKVENKTFHTENKPKFEKTKKCPGAKKGEEVGADIGVGGGGGSGEP